MEGSVAPLAQVNAIHGLPLLREASAAKDARRSLMAGGRGLLDRKRVQIFGQKPLRHRVQHPAIERVLAPRDRCGYREQRKRPEILIEPARKHHIPQCSDVRERDGWAPWLLTPELELDRDWDCAWVGQP